MVERVGELASHRLMGRDEQQQVGLGDRIPTRLDEHVPTSAKSHAHRNGPVEQRKTDLATAPRLLPAALRPAGEDQPPLGRFLCRHRSAEKPLDLRGEHERPSDADVVVVPLELTHGAVSRTNKGIRVQGFRSQVHVQVHPGHGRLPSNPWLMEGLGACHGLGQDRLGPLQLPDFEQGVAQAGQHLQGGAVVTSRQPSGPVEQGSGCRHVAPPVRLLAGEAEPVRGAPGQVTGVAVVPSTQRQPTLDGPLEVVADDLVSRTVSDLEPPSERLVQLGMRTRRTAAMRPRGSSHGGTGGLPQRRDSRAR